MHFPTYHLHLDISSACYGSLFMPAFLLKPGWCRHSIWVLHWNSAPSASQILAPLHGIPFSTHIIKHLILHALGLAINSFMSYFFSSPGFKSHIGTFCTFKETVGCRIWVWWIHTGLLFIQKRVSLINTRELGGSQPLGWKQGAGRHSSSNTNAFFLFFFNTNAFYLRTRNNVFLSFS